MAFICPGCSSSKGSLEIEEKIALAPDSLWDEITLQIVECSDCQFSGIAVYEESRRGGLDSEVSEHFGYWIEEQDVQKIRNQIKQCPKPTNWRCGCQTHQNLGAQDSNGRWKSIKEIKKGARFELKWSA